MARKNEYLTSVDKIIGSKIYSLRLAKGLTRVQLAEAIEVTHQQLQKYEKGLNRISVGRLVLMSKVLGENIKYFLEEEKSNKGIEVTITQHQRMCIEVSNNFMKITNPKQQEAVNTMVRALVGNEYKHKVGNI